ncbi:autoinducer 2 aldolase, partial [Salmonella enterica subsp. enterica serovar Enteritidis str. 50-5646]
IFQSEDPVAMIKAVHAVVHHNETAERAYEPMISAQTARPTVIPAALAKGKNSFIKDYFWNHLL